MAACDAATSVSPTVPDGFLKEPMFLPLPSSYTGAALESATSEGQLLPCLAPPGLQREPTAPRCEPVDDASTNSGGPASSDALCCANCDERLARVFRQQGPSALHSGEEAAYPLTEELLEHFDPSNPFCNPWDPWGSQIPAVVQDEMATWWAESAYLASSQAEWEASCYYGQPRPGRKLSGSGKGRLDADRSGGGPPRWWTKPDAVPLCPLSQFPITMLPYPPFKLRNDPHRSSPHRLVDGKYLAMTLIVTGRMWACGRHLVETDIAALDDYMHRSKLGPYRPGRYLRMAGEASDPAVAAELQRFVSATRTELGKLRRIQENRLNQLARQQASGPKHSSGTMSTVASTAASSFDLKNETLRAVPIRE